MRTATKDMIMHLLAEHHGEKLPGLIGIDHAGVKLATKLPAEIVDPDCVWDLGDRLVNLEMETDMGVNMGWRLFEYRARLRMQPDLRDRPLHQHVLVLDTGSPPGWPRATITEGTVRIEDHEQAWFSYRVHLFRNIDPADMLTDPITAVFAPLGRSTNAARPALVRRAAEVIAASGEADRPRLLECLKIIAGLRINDPTTIEHALQEVVMALDLTRSSTVKPLLVAAEARGRVMGMLELRFGPDERVTVELAQRLMAEPEPARLIAGAATLDELVGW